MPAGMVLCELVTNSLKYAFPGQRGGVTKLSIRQDGGDVVLEVTDDGVGLPLGFEPEGSSSFGWVLIHSLGGSSMASWRSRASRAST